MLFRSFPFATWFVYRDMPLLLLSVFVGGLILWKHRGNMVRIVKGTESKFTLHKKTQAAVPDQAEGQASVESAEKPAADTEEEDNA